MGLNEKYVATDQLLHLLSQVIARTNRTFVSAQEDDSHTNLYFDAINGRILGRWFSQGHRKFILGLDINDLLFELIDETMESVKRVYVLGKNISQVNEDIELALKSHNFDTSDFGAPMHYSIPDYKFDNKKFKLPDPAGIKQWKRIRSLANDSVTMFAELLNREVQARIWPHHFDTGVYVKANEDIGLGFGLAMSDSMLGEPYFYLSGYNGSARIAVDDFADLLIGEWKHTDSWDGAVLRMSVLNDNEDDNRNLLDSFITKASETYLEP